MRVTLTLKLLSNNTQTRSTVDAILSLIFNPDNIVHQSSPGVYTFGPSAPAKPIKSENPTGQLGGLSGSLNRILNDQMKKSLAIMKTGCNFSCQLKNRVDQFQLKFFGLNKWLIYNETIIVTNKSLD